MVRLDWSRFVGLDWRRGWVVRLDWMMLRIDWSMFVMVVRFTEISWVSLVVSLLVVVDSGVVGWPMASLHHLVTDLPALHSWEEGEAGHHHQMYTD